MAKQPKSGTPALAELQRAGVEFSAREFEHAAGERSYGVAAAAALGVEPARVFKTLVAVADGRPVVGIVPVDRQLSLKAIAAAVGSKRAEIATPADAERITGYVVGGISPFGQKRRLATVLDESATAFATIYVSGGRRGLDVELAPSSLVAVLGATTAPIST
ncbi:MAG: Cys-tRNA(Pro) deacylase [Acidimicrobiia bacterium]